MTDDFSTIAWRHDGTVAIEPFIMTKCEQTTAHKLRFDFKQCESPDSIIVIYLFFLYYFARFYGLK